MFKKGLNNRLLDEAMEIAFVLINTEMAYESDATRALREIKEVKDVYVVYGVYDLVVRVEAETMQKLKDVISTEIRRLENVRSTLTMIVTE